MAVSFINSAIATATTSVSSIVVTYAPTAGNVVVIGARLNGAGTSPACKDNNLNALTANPNNTSTQYQFYGTAITGATSYTITWSTSTRLADVVLGEYAGVAGVGTTASATTTSSNPVITLTSTKTNSWAIANFGVGAIITFTQGASGTLRAQAKGGSAQANSGCLNDNSGGASGSAIINQVNLASAAWGAFAVELYPTQTAAVTYNQLMMVGCGA